MTDESDDFVKRMERMREFILTLKSTVWGNLGHCGMCMRKSFLTASIAWLAGIFFWLIDAPIGILAMSFTLAIGLTVAWMAHLVVFAVKVVAAHRLHIDEDVSLVGMASRPLSRRQVYSVFVRALATVAIATAVPAIARAQVPGCYCTNGCAYWCGPNCPFAYQRVMNIAGNCGPPACSTQ